MTVSHQSSPASALPATAFGAVRSFGDKLAASRWLLPAFLVAICFIAYAPSLTCPPLLDEQFVLSFVKHAGDRTVPLSQFLAFKGLDAADLWGALTPLALKCGQILCFGQLFLMRYVALALHTGTTVLLFSVLRRLSASVFVPFAAALLFAVYPLNCEAVTWIGGRGSLFAGLLTIGALRAYMESGWRWLVVSVCLYAMALFCSASVWPLCLIFAGFELYCRVALKPDEFPRDGTLSVVAPLGFLVVTAAYIASTGLLFQLTTLSAPDLHGNSIFQLLRGCFLPINESIFPKYVRHYRFLYFVLGPALVFLVAALVRDSKLRFLTAFFGVWFLLCLQPLFGHVDVRGTMYGAHLLYTAAQPACGLLACLLLSLPKALPRGRGAAVVGAVLSALCLTSISIFFLFHVWKQNGAYDAGAKTLAKVQKSIRIIRDRQALPYIMARDIPETVALMPGFSTAAMAVFDAYTGLLSAPNVSSGMLKDQLLAGKAIDAAFRFDHDMKSLVALDLGQTPTSNVDLNAQQIAARLMPGIEFYKNARLDDDKQNILLESNSTSGAAIKLSAEGFAPLAPDFLYVDAKIDGPKMEAEPLIELYWTTADHPDYDNKFRRVIEKVIIGDGEYHRYFLPLRSVGWVTGGPAKVLTMGFPAGARVFLKAIGGADKAQVIPQFAVVPQIILGQTDSKSRFDAPFFNFPRLPQLGLVTLPEGADTVVVSHSSESIAGSAGVMIEISMPNKQFPNPNGNQASGVGGSWLGVSGTKGMSGIPISQFPMSGLYSLRAVAIDGHHHQIGNFSDDAYVLVTRKQDTGWALQP